MNNALTQSFFDASGFHASYLSAMIRLIAGLVMVVVAVWMIAGFLALLETGAADHRLRFMLCLVGLGVLLMVYFTFVVG